MKETVNRWFETVAAVRGVLACGVRHPDKTSVIRSWSVAYAEGALEQAWRCVGDTYQVLKLNHLPDERMRWVYERALLYCERRKDGTCLGIFTARDPQAVDLAGLADLVQTFHALE